MLLWFSFNYWFPFSTAIPGVCTCKKIWADKILTVMVLPLPKFDFVTVLCWWCFVRSAMCLLLAEVCLSLQNCVVRKLYTMALEKLLLGLFVLFMICCWSISPPRLVIKPGVCFSPETLNCLINCELGLFTMCDQCLKWLVRFVCILFCCFSWGGSLSMLKIGGFRINCTMLAWSLRSCSFSMVVQLAGLGSWCSWFPANFGVLTCWKTGKVKFIRLRLGRSFLDQLQCCFAEIVFQVGFAKTHCKCCRVNVFLVRYCTVYL